MNTNINGTSTFAKNLCYYRKLRNLSQKELAEKSHLSATAISQYENGSKNPTLESLNALASALGVKMRHLCEDRKLKGTSRMVEAVELLSDSQCYIHVDDDETISISLSQCNDTINKERVIEFFKNYEMIQNFNRMAMSSDIESKHELCRVGFDMLMERFSDILDC